MNLTNHICVVINQHVSIYREIKKKRIYENFNMLKLYVIMWENKSRRKRPIEIKTVTLVIWYLNIEFACKEMNRNAVV